LEVFRMERCILHPHTHVDANTKAKKLAQQIEEKEEFVKVPELVKALKNDDVPGEMMYHLQNDEHFPGCWALEALTC
jgi:hypothetical protein